MHHITLMTLDPSRRPQTFNINPLLFQTEYRQLPTVAFFHIFHKVESSSITEEDFCHDFSLTIDSASARTRGNTIIRRRHLQVGRQERQDPLWRSATC
jgi:hypothetical protein